MADKITPETLAELRRLHAAYMAAREAVIESRAPGAAATAGLEQKLALAAKMELHDATLDALIPILDALAAADAERDRLREALEEIVEPLPAMHRRAVANGHRLSGMAYEIAHSRSHAVSIARAALGDAP